MSISQNFPNTRPSLVLDFANSKKLDSRITFTRGSTGTYVDDSGLIRTAGINEARFDHDPVTGDSLGLLIEESRTNLLLRSEDLLTAPNYSAGNLASFFTATLDSLPAPNGATNQTVKFVSTSTTSEGLFLRQTGLSLSAGNYTSSIYVYVPTQAGITNWGMVFDYGDAESGSSTTSTVFDRWVRVSASATLAATRSFLDFNVRINGTAPSTSGVTLYAWGIQVEVSSFPTSYIPTSGSTATRSADNASLTGTNFSSWYNQTEGTFITSAKYDGTPIVGATNRSVFTGWAGVNVVYWNVLWESNNKATFVVEDPPGTYHAVLSNGDTISLGDRRRTASVYKANDFSFTTNGLTPVTDTSGAITSTVTTLYIGNLTSDIWQLNGRIGKIAYYPVRLPNDQLQTLTK